MTRLTKQQKREKRIHQISDQVWAEVDQIRDEVVGQWLDASGMSREEVHQIFDDLNDKLIALIQLFAGSLARHGKSMDDVAEAAACFGRVLVELSLQLYDE